MRWRTHTAIARALADLLGLDREGRSALLRGSTDPDKYPDLVVRVSGRGRVYTARAPHHNPSLRVIMKHVWRARRSYLSGDQAEAARSLGRALHYVQDACVSKGILGLSHDSREDEVAGLSLPTKAVREGLSSSLCSPHYVERTLKLIRPQKDPGKALEEACRASGAIAAAVFGAKTPPEGLMDEYAEASRRHWRRIMPLAVLFSAFFLALTIATQNLSFVLGALSGYAIHLLDRRYHYLKKEAEWYKAG